MSECACGCGKNTAEGRNFRQGHDAKLRSEIEERVGGLLKLKGFVDEHLSADEAQGLTDKATLIETLRQKVVKFRNERNWEQFHDPKNLATALSIESAELQELFLWKTREEVSELVSDNEKHERIKEELADIFIFLLYLSEACDVDLSEAVTDKVELNAKKYPVEKSFNSHKKYNELD